MFALLRPLGRASLSCAKLHPRPHSACGTIPHRQPTGMLIGARTRSNQREEWMSSPGRFTPQDDSEDLKRLHTSSTLDGIRNSASSELHRGAGAWERERALHFLRVQQPSRIIYPAGMAAAFTLMFLWGINPLAQLDRLWLGYLHALSVAPLLTKMCTAGVCTLVGDYLAQILPFLLKSSGPGSQSGSIDLNGIGVAGKPGSGAPSGGLDQRNVKALEVAAGLSSSEFTSDSNGTGGLLAGFKYDPARAARFLLFSVFIATPVAHQWFAFLDKVILPDAPTSPMAVLLKMMSDQFLMTPFMTCVFFAAMTVLEGHPDRALNTVKSKIRPTLKANYLLWPAAHLVNFGLVPLDLRILYINVIAIFWTVYLSSVAASKSA